MAYILLFVFFILFPICGFQSLEKGEVDSALFFFSPWIVLICYLLINHFYVKPRKKRQEAVSKMYNLPNRIEHEYGELWNREFQKVINKAINTTTDSKKLTDLHHCKRVAGEMIKDSGSYRLDRPFYKINNAFRLTGCHITITDSEGNSITQIV